jgi:hypothetical protein
VAILFQSWRRDLAIVWRRQVGSGPAASISAKSAVSSSLGVRRTSQGLDTTCDREMRLIFPCHVVGDHGEVEANSPFTKLIEHGEI